LKKAAFHGIIATMNPADRTENPQGVRAQAVFQGTRWSVVLNARGKESRVVQTALSELGRMYWYPLYVFARGFGHSHHEAEDLTQGFFEHLISKDGLANVGPEKGRFRSFLLSSMKHFMANERDRARALRRGGAHSVVSIDMPDAEGRYGCEPVDDLTPRDMYDRSWATTLLRDALNDLEQEYRARGKEVVFDALREFVTESGRGNSCADVGQSLKMSEGHVKVLIHRHRRRFGRLLRDRVAQTVQTEQDIDDEIRYLMSCFTN